MKSNSKVLIVFISLLGVVSAGISMFYSQNIPLLDDYNLCLDFISSMKSEDGVFKCFESIFQFQNGHPMVTQKLVFLLDRAMFGFVDFRHFIFLNNLLHVSLLIAFYKVFRLRSVLTYFFLPIVLLIAVPVYNLNNWSSSFLHVMTLSASLYSFYYLVGGKKTSFLFGIALAIIAAFSSGPGIISLYSGIPIVLILYEKRLWFAWFLITILISGYYIYFYISAQGFGGSQFVSLPIYVANFFVFFGAIFKSIYGDHHIWGLLFGFWIFSMLVYVAFRYRRELVDNPIIISLMLFSIFIALFATVMRSQFGLGATTAYRYRFYQIVPIVVLLISFLWFNKVAFRSSFIPLIIFATMMYGFRMEDSIHDLRLRKNQLIMGARLFKEKGDPDQLTYRDQKMAGQILTLARSSEIYRIPNLSLPMSVSNQIAFNYQMETTLEINTRSDDFLYLKGRAYLKSLDLPGIEIRIGYKEGDKWIHFPTSPVVSSTALLPGVNQEFFFCANVTHLNNEVIYYVIMYHWLRGVVAWEEVPRL